MNLKLIKIWDIKLKSNKHYKCIMLFIGGLSISIVSLGLNKTCIRIKIKWGWK